MSHTRKDWNLRTSNGVLGSNESAAAWSGGHLVWKDVWSRQRMAMFVWSRLRPQFHIILYPFNVLIPRKTMRNPMKVRYFISMKTVRSINPFSSRCTRNSLCSQLIANLLSSHQQWWFGFIPIQSAAPVPPSSSHNSSCSASDCELLTRKVNSRFARAKLFFIDSFLPSLIPSLIHPFIHSKEQSSLLHSYVHQSSEHTLLFVPTIPDLINHPFTISFWAHILRTYVSYPSEMMRFKTLSEPFVSISPEPLSHGWVGWA